MNPKTKRNPLPPHWYISYYSWCPVCDRKEFLERKRVFEKPENSVVWDEHYDWCEG